MAASSGAFAAALLGAALLQGCGGGWTEESYCKEKVKVECENFDRLFAKHEGENKEGLGIMLHKASHLRFYKQCKEKDAKGWEELEKQCKGLKDKDHTLGDGTKCKDSVSKAMEKHEDLSFGRTVLGCIEKGLEADGKEEFDHEAKPKKDKAESGGPTDKPVESKPKVFYCDCRPQPEIPGCDGGAKALPTDPEVEDVVKAKELCGKLSPPLQLLAWKCRGGEGCTDLEPGVVGHEDEAEKACIALTPAGQACTRDNDDSPLTGDTQPLTGYTCKDDEGGVKEISTKELSEIYTDKGYSSGKYPDEVIEAITELCKEKDGELVQDGKSSELQLASEVHDLPAHPPAPRRKRAEGLVLAQEAESTRVEVDSSGVAKVRSFATPPRAGAEVKPDGKSRMVSE